MTRSCLVLGGTGLVGGHLLEALGAGEDYPTITALVRRTRGLGDARVREVEADLARPPTYLEHVAVDDVYCCLGTTLKKAGSEAAFLAVDRDYPIAIARAAREAGATRFVIVTAVGASPTSPLFYNRAKGEVEAGLTALGFPRGVKIVRPSMLLGARGEPRAAERVGGAVMGALAPLFRGPMARFRAVDAMDVAKAMIAAGREASEGTQAFEGAELFALAAAVGEESR